jgi:hypothetical protein
MNENIYYEVEISEGRSFFGKKKTRSSLYFDNDPLKARKSAFEFVASTLSGIKSFSPAEDSFLTEKIDSKQKFKPISIVVYFVKCKVEKYQVYGPEVHETIYGLYEEAKYYQKKGIIFEEDLETVLQNKDSEDIHNPAFIISQEPAEFPYIDFSVVKVLVQDLNFILPRNKYSFSRCNTPAYS